MESLQQSSESRKKKSFGGRRKKNEKLHWTICKENIKSPSSKIQSNSLVGYYLIHAGWTLHSDGEWEEKEIWSELARKKDFSEIVCQIFIVLVRDYSLTTWFNWWDLLCWCGLNETGKADGNEQHMQHRGGVTRMSKIGQSTALRPVKGSSDSMNNLLADLRFRRGESHLFSAKKSSWALKDNTDLMTKWEKNREERDDCVLVFIQRQLGDMFLTRTARIYSFSSFCPLLPCLLLFFFLIMFFSLEQLPLTQFLSVLRKQRKARVIVSVSLSTKTTDWNLSRDRTSTERRASWTQQENLFMNCRPLTSLSPTRHINEKSIDHWRQSTGLTCRHGKRVSTAQLMTYSKEKTCKSTRQDTSSKWFLPGERRESLVHDLSCFHRLQISEGNRALWNKHTRSRSSRSCFSIDNCLERSRVYWPTNSKGVNCSDLMRSLSDLHLVSLSRNDFYLGGETVREPGGNALSKMNPLVVDVWSCVTSADMKAKQTPVLHFCSSFVRWQTCFE